MIVSVSERISRLQNRLLDRLRHRDAFAVSNEVPIVGDFSDFRGARQCLLITFKRSGEPVPSPVNFGLSDDGTLFARCEPNVAKVRRIRNDPRVHVCPCSFRGKPLGPLVRATARIVPESGVQRAHRILAANWDPLSRVFERAVDLVHTPVVYIEISPSA